MSYHRNNPPPQQQSPPPRYDFELGHSPTHNFDQGNTNEQRRREYQEIRNPTKAMTSGSHRHGPSNDLPPPAQHIMHRHSNHGSSLNPGRGALGMGRGNDHMYHSALPMPSLHHHPILTNDRYGPPEQRSPAKDMSFNNVNREPRPSRSWRRENPASHAAGHTHRCSCPRYITVATTSLDSQKTERVGQKSDEFWNNGPCSPSTTVL
jgi:hypothetical protein